MSRIGNKPVTIPEKVKVNISGQVLTVEGPLGKLKQDIHPRIKVTVKDNQVTVSRATDINTDRALHGLVRSLIQNMVIGVTQGYKKELLLEGVGYKAQMKGKEISLSLGYTHPVNYPIPDGVEVKCTKPTEILVSGMDKQKVGQVASDIRAFHEPEPYKGKGVRYLGEYVRRKQGKTVG